jgi:hypothetical protein
MLDMHNFAIVWKMLYEFLVNPMAKGLCFYIGLRFETTMCISICRADLDFRILTLWGSAMNCKLSSITKHSNSSHMP